MTQNTKWVVTTVRKDKRFAPNLDAHRSTFNLGFYHLNNAEQYLEKQRQIHLGDDEYSSGLWKAEENMVFTCGFGDEK